MSVPRHAERKKVTVMASRERQVTRAFVRLADTLVADYDVAELLYTLAEDCVRLLDATAAGLLLADHHGQLQVLASSTERTRLLELFQLQTDQGPCVECYRSRTPVLVPDLAAEQDRVAALRSRSAAGRLCLGARVAVAAA